ncbi:TetR/AcrR family transcriptional regulator [Frankia sp. Ag45/Mut15]|uniref:TetR/AcrR family transcriptional regulator n=1 Tax=Frankia umida TaxID=573489 RepID=A0ABT0K340_9ACTN|nr:TetR/AcrR family transcriptional regulator [Frankia umida]MCK9878185.1 TetR/AcrR family transcriptional regulator [Frankia umida]
MTSAVSSSEVPGRAQRWRRTHDALSAAAISLFLERGFDQVSVAEVAAAARVTKPTLFAHFPAKEDLVLHRIVDHRGEAARVVAHRGDARTPLDALEAHLRAGLDRHEPVTGLNDIPEVLAFHGMVFGTPSLLGRVARYADADERALAAALVEACPDAGELTARLAAAQIVVVHRVLARENWTYLSTGTSVTARHPAAVTAAVSAFAGLRRAFPDYA